MRKSSPRKAKAPFPLAAVLKRLGITKYQLAKRAQMQESQIFALSRRTANPTWRVLTRLAKALGCSLAEFDAAQN